MGDLSNDGATLVDRLERCLLHEKRPVVFMVGSALSMRWQAGGGFVGVPPTSKMVERIWAEIGAPPPKGTAGEQYQEGVKKLIHGHGQTVTNRVIQDAVLQAVLPKHRPPEGASPPELDHLEERPSAWQLPEGAAALGRIAAYLPTRCPWILTTNFDPLLQVAIRTGGGRPTSRVRDRDGDLSGVHVDRRSVQVVHLHGHWHRSDTLHTDLQLNKKRPRLQASLLKIMTDATVVVLGYGGWHDVFTKTLGQLTSNHARTDVLWCFYEPEADAKKAYKKIHRVLSDAFGRAPPYYGIDAHKVLPELARRLAVHDALPHPGGYVGRHAVRKEVWTALHGHEQKSVQLLTLPKTGGSDFLRDLADRLRLWGHRVARLDAHHFAASPVGLVQAAGRALDRAREVDERLYQHRATPKLEDASAAIEKLGKAVLLVDHADALAADHNGFEPDFWDALKVEEDCGQIKWISTSPQGLADLYNNASNTSPFLNGAAKVHLGRWSDKDGRRGLKGSNDDEVQWAWSVSGGVPVAARRLIAQIRAGQSRSEAEAHLDGWMKDTFEMWVEAMSEAERMALRELQIGMRFSKLTTDEKDRCRELVKRSLVAPLVNPDNPIQWLGEAWARFAGSHVP